VIFVHIVRAAAGAEFFVLVLLSAWHLWLYLYLN